MEKVKQKRSDISLINPRNKTKSKPGKYGPLETPDVGSGV